MTVKTLTAEKRAQRLEYFREAIKNAAVNLRVITECVDAIQNNADDDFTTRALLDQSTGIFRDVARMAQLAAELHAETLAGN